MKFSMRPRAVSADSELVERRRVTPFHNRLATLVTIIFALICGSTYGIVTGKAQLESWAAGIVGAVLGYWANNLTQIISYYFGSSSGPTHQAEPGMSRPGRLIRGKGPPPNGIGADGDYYEDERKKDIYGPKFNGAWGPARDVT